MSRDPLAYLFSFIGDLEKRLTPALSAESEKVKGHTSEAGQYKYIALPHHSFYQQMQALADIVGIRMHKVTKSVSWSKEPVTGDEPLPYHFVDVGCGIGTKLILAKRIWDNSMDGYDAIKLHGIEYTSEYVEVAKKLVPEATIIQADALTCDYSAYDFIYFYCPLHNVDMQKQLEVQIANTMKPGAYVLANLRMNKPLWDAPNMKRIWGNRQVGALIVQKLEHPDTNMDPLVQGNEDF